ncbi:hypothetical protein SGUI_0744 [Serinicoccus hydrothermalis]|uniref:ER-bound oxygenase mpaB/mpaB'/Rubber oxygenase catalytic domain-containing protein n=1 Tax=Serinicoccus hydrothermalis TaxID=1758689 RepID=A0A1B1N9L3_9MICO|nr:hypothetical protein SGUI_0744 [Serinicoccus hydrothermalis]
MALGRLQSALGSALRARVAGEDAADRAARIWDSPGERWFTDEDPVWRVHADAAMFPGGVAALLLQMLHPMAMAGVAGHSGYKGDPWGRLQRTSTYLAATTFGTVEHALETIGHVRSIHERVRGKDAFGRPYRASDPHLLRWVHVAEAWSFLGAYQTFAQRPLTPAEADTYVAQAGVSAAHLGVLDPPRSARALEEELRAYRPELEATTQAREAARFLLVEPPLPVVSRPGYWAIAAGGVALLPDWARAELGLPASPTLSRGVLRPLGRASTSTVRWAMAGAGRDPERAA